MRTKPIGGAGSRRTGAKVPLFLAIFVGLSAAPACNEAKAPSAPEGPARRALALTHVTLIDPASGPRNDVTIVIEGERVVDVGPSASLAPPKGAVVRDASGRFALPGLFDAHAHVSQIGEDSARLFVANGVTGVRDMGSAFAEIVRWRESRARGAPVPRVFSPGPKLDGAGDAGGTFDEGDDNWVLPSPDEARKAVRRLKAIGADFIKVHGGLSRPIYDALADESRKNGLAFAGHVGPEFPASVAVAAGQRTIEHGRGMAPCPQGLRARLRDNKELSPLVSVCEPEGAAGAALQEMARAGVWLTPTLVSWRGQTADRAAAARLEGVRYATPALERRWGEPATPRPEELEIVAAIGALAAAADRAGVALLVGSDAGDPFVVPGFAVHDEMRLLVEAGVSPLRAIRGATLEPAKALGVADSAGSIERGKAADLVLLDADPLADIRNTRRISAVVLKGRLLSKEELDALVAPLRRPG